VAPSVWPHPFNPLINGEPDAEVTVQVFQHRPDLTAQLVDWCSGDRLTLNGGPVVLLPGTRPANQRLVGLGDFAVRAGDTWRAEPASGFYSRWAPA
jgi:hypothetical protein